MSGDQENGPAHLGPLSAHGCVTRRVWATLKKRWVLCTLLLVIAALTGWVYWLPLARTYYDQPQAVGAGVSKPNFDFYQYYAAGHNWNLGLDPYRNHAGVPGAIYHPRSATQSGYIYPPTLLPVYGMLAGLPYDMARGLWLAFNAAVFGLALVVATIVSRGRRLEVLAIGVLLIAISHPLLYAVRQGQADMAVAGLTTLSFVLYRRWGSWPSAALLAIAVLTKTVPLFVLAMMVVYYRDVRFLAKVAASLLVVVGISLTMVAGHLYLEYAERVIFAVGSGSTFEMNQSLLRFWAQGLPSSVGVASAVFYVGILVFAWFLGGKYRRELSDGESGQAGPRIVDAAFYMLTVSLMLLFSPLAWHMWFVWIIVPAALLLAHDLRSGLTPRSLAVAAGVLLMSAQISVWHEVLESLNMIGAAVTAIAILLLYPELRGAPRSLSLRGASDTKAARQTDAWSQPTEASVAHGHTSLECAALSRTRVCGRLDSRSRAGPTTDRSVPALD